MGGGYFCYGYISTPMEGNNQTKIHPSNALENTGSSSNADNILPTPGKSSKLENYLIYAAQPTNSKAGTLIWDYDPNTDEYLNQFTMYQSSNGGYQADKSTGSWGKRWQIEGMCKTGVGRIDPNRPFKKYGYMYYPDA